MATHTPMTNVPQRTRLPRAERERQVLDVAHARFAAHGYAAVTMDDVAAGAGVTKPLLYAYFGNKERLYLACMERAGDAMFAIDFLSLTIETAIETTVPYYGWPIGSENNGFGIGLADGGDLPAVLPDSIAVGATGTGFDETISSKSIYLVPEPGMTSLLAIAGLAIVSRGGRVRKRIT